MAAAACDIAIFVTPHGKYARKAMEKAGFNPEAIHVIPQWQEAALFLRRLLAPGDLALVKGHTTDHLSRLLFALLGTVGCQETRCTRLMLCDDCTRLNPQIEIHPVGLKRPLWHPRFW
jgi:hypothetical protein